MTPLTPPSVEQRLTHVESDILQLRHQASDTESTLAGHIESSNTALAQLSDAVEELRLRVQETSDRLDSIDNRLDRFEHTVDERFTGVESVLQQILDRLS